MNLGEENAVADRYDRKVPPLAVDDRVLLCVIYDKKAEEVIGGVFICRTKGEAIRMFSDGVNQGGEQRSVVQLHPEDFQLVKVGLLDRNACAVEGWYELLIEGSEVKRVD